jgi:hypothetical protein
MTTATFQLTANDAYAFRRVLSKMDVPADLNLSPLARLMLDTLDPLNNTAHWQMLQEMVTRDHQIMQQVLYIDPKAQPPDTLKDPDELYVPPLPKLLNCMTSSLQQQMVSDTSTVTAPAGSNRNHR